MLDIGQAPSPGPRQKEKVDREGALLSKSVTSRTRARSAVFPMVNAPIASIEEGEGLPASAEQHTEGRPSHIAQAYLRFGASNVPVKTPLVPPAPSTPAGIAPWGQQRGRMPVAPAQAPALPAAPWAPGGAHQPSAQMLQAWTQAGSAALPPYQSPEAYPPLALYPENAYSEPIPWGPQVPPTAPQPTAATPWASRLRGYQATLGETDMITVTPQPAPPPIAPIPWGYRGPLTHSPASMPSNDDVEGVRWQRPAAAPLAVPAMGRDTVTDHGAMLKAFAQDLGARGMSSALASALLSETVTEYGAAALAHSRDLRLAFVEQLLLRIPVLPLTGEGTALSGTYIVTGLPGSGKSAVIAHLADEARRQGQKSILLVNAQERRLGAAATMEAIGAALTLPVAHVYSADEMHQVIENFGHPTVVLVEADSITPQSASTWPWTGVPATTLLCLPASGQSDDLRTLVSRASTLGPARVAILTMTDLTQNALPALSVLAQTNCPVGLVTADPFDTQDTIDLGEVARQTLGLNENAQA